MRLSFSNQIQINAPAQAAWNVLAHEFTDIAMWSSVISHSHGLSSPMDMDDAELGSRVCTVPGFGETHERLLNVDESAMRFSYSATMSRAPYVRRAFNDWAVIPNGATSCTVKTRASLELAFFPWVLAAPAIQLGTWWLWRRTSADLKYYVEHGVPHPRKRKPARQQRSTAR